MLDVILIAIAVGIVSRLAKSKGHPPLFFGVATAVIAKVTPARCVHKTKPSQGFLKS